MASRDGKSSARNSKHFPKFNISGKTASNALCILDGQLFSKHSKKMLERHALILQMSYTKSQTELAELKKVKQ